MSLKRSGTKLKAFDAFETVYKEVRGHQFGVTVFVPKLARGRAPVMVRWHGGGLVTGHRKFEDWFPRW